MGMGFYPIEAGDILIDGHSVCQHLDGAFRKQTSVVFQEVLVLNGTIMDNIRAGCLGASDSECIEAAKDAEIHSHIMSMPDRYNTVLGQHASSSLSGGQQQRVCLARAL